MASHQMNEWLYRRWCTSFQAFFVQFRERRFPVGRGYGSLGALQANWTLKWENFKAFSKQTGRCYTDRSYATHGLASLLEKLP